MYSCTNRTRGIITHCRLAIHRKLHMNISKQYSSVYFGNTSFFHWFAMWNTKPLGKKVTVGWGDGLLGQCGSEFNPQKLCLKKINSGVVTWIYNPSSGEKETDHWVFWWVDLESMTDPISNYNGALKKMTEVVFWHSLCSHMHGKSLEPSLCSKATSLSVKEWFSTR